MFGTSYVGFGSDPTYTQKIMKIPDIAWPTFFDSYRESMLSFKTSLFLLWNEPVSPHYLNSILIL